MRGNPHPSRPAEHWYPFGQSESRQSAAKYDEDKRQFLHGMEVHSMFRQTYIIRGRVAHVSRTWFFDCRESSICGCPGSRAFRDPGEYHDCRKVVGFLSFSSCTLQSFTRTSPGYW